VQKEQTEWVSGQPASEGRRLDLPLPSVDDKVAQGQDGWLFLANDSNDTMGQHAGARLLTGHQVEQWQYLLESRAAWLGMQGIPYYFVIAPDAHAIYPDMLPEGVQQGTTRPALQVLDRLRERDSWAPVFYPLEELLAERESLVYPKTGSHWSEYGAFIAYRALMARIAELLPVRSLSREEIHLSYERRSGDLGRKFDPPVISRYVYVDVIEPRAELVEDNRIRNHGRLVEYNADTDDDLTCLVFGDSFAVRVMPLVAESFRRSFWAHLYFDHELVSELRPDVVVTVAAERGMIVVETDTDPGLRRLEARKRSEGDVMPPRLTQSSRINSRRLTRAPQRPDAAGAASAEA
jgi:alginate O-acetyltransferase complex protein AlgJ